MSVKLKIKNLSPLYLYVDTYLDLSFVTHGCLLDDHLVHGAVLHYFDVVAGLHLLAVDEPDERRVGVGQLHFEGRWLSLVRLLVLQLLLKLILDCG